MAYLGVGDRCRYDISGRTTELVKIRLRSDLPRVDFPDEETSR
jgi:hypothetical protein